MAGHCISDLLAHGYDVRGTVRNLGKADLAHLRPAIDEAVGAFDLAEATLDADEGWAEATSGCDYVLPVASATGGFESFGGSPGRGNDWTIADQTNRTASGVEFINFGITSNGQPTCLDVYGDNPAPNTVVDLYRCNGTDAQIWQISLTG